MTRDQHQPVLVADAQSQLSHAQPSSTRARSDHELVASWLSGLGSDRTRANFATTAERFLTLTGSLSASRTAEPRLNGRNRRRDGKPKPVGQLARRNDGAGVPASAANGLYLELVMLVIDQRRGAAGVAVALFFLRHSRPPQTLATGRGFLVWTLSSWHL
jgi:hypothetical protein